MEAGLGRGLMLATPGEPVAPEDDSSREHQFHAIPSRGARRHAPQGHAKHSSDPARAHLRLNALEPELKVQCERRSGKGQKSDCELHVRSHGPP